ncbi:MAG: hypothetical protein HYT30_01740 [Parcubacteria group bacterium]|nr:hypothetical protein [Parcubacteria group bacterium]
MLGKNNVTHIDHNERNLNKMQREAERLVALLKNRQPNLASWNIALEDCARKMRELLS